MTKRFDRIYALIKRVKDPSEKTQKLIDKFEKLYFRELESDG